MKIAFFGTGDFSASILKSLLDSQEVDISLVISQPDKPVGRKKIIEKTPVKKIAESYDIEILQPTKLKIENNKEFYEQLYSLELDFIVVVAYGRIMPKELLEVPKFGAINIHGSLLPLYRGASPIQESIKNGDTETGITIMYMSERMDEGDVLSVKKVDIDINDNTTSIFKKFEKEAPLLLINTLTQIISGDLKGTPQKEEEATYCSKIEKSDGKINFQKETAKEIYDKARAYHIWPGIFTSYNEKKFQITDCFFEEITFCEDGFIPGDVIELEDEDGIKKQIGIVCKEGILILKSVKLEGKKETDIISFVNGNKDFLGWSFED